MNLIQQVQQQPADAPDRSIIKSVKQCEPRLDHGRNTGMVINNGGLICYQFARRRGSQLCLPATLREADLTRADLRMADLFGANLTGANVTGADLRMVDLRMADLSGANLTGANLTGADLRGADVDGAVDGG